MSFKLWKLSIVDIFSKRRHSCGLKVTNVLVCAEHVGQDHWEVTEDGNRPVKECPAG